MIRGITKSRVPSLGPIIPSYTSQYCRLTADARRSTISHFFVVVQTIAINNDTVGTCMITPTTELVATVWGTNHPRALDRMDRIGI